LEARDKTMLESIKNLGQGSVKLYRAKGCSKCNDTGYKGRSGIYEVLQVSEKIKPLIINKATESDINKVATEEGMITLLQDGYLKALEGVTTLEEVLRVAKE